MTDENKPADPAELKKYLDRTDIKTIEESAPLLKGDSKDYMSGAYLTGVSLHESWDKHIMTLSTAALGFIFAILPLSEWGVYHHLSTIGAGAFVLSIGFAMYGLLLAGDSFEITQKVHSHRQELIVSMDDLIMSNNIIKGAYDNQPVTAKHLKNADSVREEVGKHTVAYILLSIEISEKLARIAEKITAFNRFKTISFLVGLLFTTAFVFANNVNGDNVKINNLDQIKDTMKASGIEFKTMPARMRASGQENKNAIDILSFESESAEVVLLFDAKGKHIRTQ